MKVNKKEKIKRALGDREDMSGNSPSDWSSWGRKFAIFAAFFWAGLAVPCLIYGISNSDTFVSVLSIFILVFYGLNIANQCFSKTEVYGEGIRIFTLFSSKEILFKEIEGISESRWDGGMYFMGGGPSFIRVLTIHYKNGNTYTLTKAYGARGFIKKFYSEIDSKIMH